MTYISLQIRFFFMPPYPNRMQSSSKCEIIISGKNIPCCELELCLNEYQLLSALVLASNSVLMVLSKGYPSKRNKICKNIYINNMHYHFPYNENDSVYSPQAHTFIVSLKFPIIYLYQRPLYGIYTQN